jgi:hypothetical protein
VARFAEILRAYGITRVTGDRLGGETFRALFEEQGVAYGVSAKTASQLYEALEPRLNAHQCVFLDVPLLEQQLLGLIWRGGKIDHIVGEHDDWSTAAAGAVALAFGAGQEAVGGPIAVGVRASPWALGGSALDAPWSRWRLDTYRPDRGWRPT